MNASFVTAEHLAKCHGRSSAGHRCDCCDERRRRLRGDEARDRRNVRSLARFPKVANASAHSVRASTCGQSSSHLSAILPARRRRSCATMASCQAFSRAHSDAASSVATPEPKIAYGFMSDPSSLVARSCDPFNGDQVRSRRARRTRVPGPVSGISESFNELFTACPRIACLKTKMRHPGISRDSPSVYTVTRHRPHRCERYFRSVGSVTVPT